MKRIIIFVTVLILGMALAGLAYSQRGGVPVAPVNPHDTPKKDSRDTLPKPAPVAPDPAPDGQPGEPGPDPAPDGQPAEPAPEEAPLAEDPAPDGEENPLADDQEGAPVIPMGENDPVIPSPQIDLPDTLIYEKACSGKEFVDKYYISDSIQEKIDGYKTQKKGINIAGGVYVLCFNKGKQYVLDGDVDVVSKVEKGDILIIHNLDFKISVYNLIGKIIIGNNVILSHLVMDNSGIVPLNPISINGSNNVMILNSVIAFQNIGVDISNSNGVLIKGTEFNGPGKDAGTGIKVIASKDIKVWDNFGTFKDMKVGIDGQVNAKNNTFDGVGQPINNPGYVVDINTIGKRMNDEETSVVELLGVSPHPDGQCKGTVEPYRYTSYAEFGKYVALNVTCNVSVLDKDMCMKPAGQKKIEHPEDKCPDTYYLISAGECVFGCEGIFIILSNDLSFMYRDNEGISYGMSAVRKTEFFPTFGQESGATTTAMPYDGQNNTPGGGNVTGADPGKFSTGNDDGHVEIDPVDIEFGSGGLGAVKSGCASVSGSPVSKVGIIIIFCLILSLSTLRALCLCRAKRKR